jgi:hypothetical protein
MAVAVVVLAALIWAEREQGRGNRVALNRPDPPAKMASTPPPTLMALSRALNESEMALDSLLARQEHLLAANDPPTIAMGASAPNGGW